MNTTMPGVMPQGSQMGTMQQPVNMPGFQPRILRPQALAVFR